MPWDEVMSKFKRGKLRSGSKTGPPVKNRKQAVAIMLDEKARAEGGDAEYQPGATRIKSRPTIKLGKK